MDSKDDSRPKAEASDEQASPAKEGERTAEDSETPPATGSETPASAAPRRLMTMYDAALSLLLLAFWLAPISWVGATRQETPLLPAWLRHQHRISCLFTNEVKGWQTYELQVQRGGSGKWEQMSEQGYFELPVFGYRSRLHRTLGHSYKRGKGALRLRELGHYIKRRYDQLNPNGPSLDALRFVRIYMTNEMLAKQTGRFKPMRPEQVPYNYTVYFGEMRFDGKRPRDAGWGHTAPRPAQPTPAAPQKKGGR